MDMERLLSIGLMTLLLAAPGGCKGEEATDGDADTDADTDTDTDTDTDGVPASAGAVAAAFAAGGGTTAGMGGPFVTDGDDLERRDGAGDADGRNAAEGAIGGHSVVTNAACVTYAWTGGLSGTVTFDGCVLELTGESLDGQIGLAVALAPTAFTLTLEALAIGASLFDGTLAMTWAGSDPEPIHVVDVDMTYEAGGACTHLVLDDVTVDADASAATLDGSGHLTTGAIDAAITMTEVTWLVGDCHPSSGVLGFDDGGPFPVTITYLPTTPSDGIVEVQVGAFPATPQPLLEPCP